MKYTYLALLLLFFACNSNVKETESGIKIEYFKEGIEKPSYGNVVLLNTVYISEEGDTLLKTRKDEPVLMELTEESIESGGSLQEVLDFLRLGDSVSFEIPAKDLFNVTFKSRIPSGIAEESNITFFLSMEEEVAFDTIEQYFFNKELEKYSQEFKSEEAELNKFIDSLNRENIELKNDVYVEIVNEGTGELVDENDNISVDYKGSLINGKEFDSGQFNFDLGKGQVIRGWDAAINGMNVGTKAILYIPSKLGYGRRGSRPNIPPFSTLVFEIEIKNVVKK